MAEREVLRIAQVAPLAASVPPTRACRAAELVKALADELVRLGHEVTLFGGPDFGGTNETACWGRRDLDRIFDAAREFDLVHSHLDHLLLCLESHASRPRAWPRTTTRSIARWRGATERGRRPRSPSAGSPPSSPMP